MGDVDRKAIPWHQRPQRPPNFLEEYTSSDSEYTSEIEDAPEQSHLLPSTRIAQQNPSTPLATTVKQPRAQPLSASHDASQSNTLGGQTRPSGRVYQIRKDNPAEARWRKRLPPDGYYVFDVPYYEIVARIPGLGKIGFFKPLMTIGRRTNTFIRMVYAGTALNDRKVNIWAPSKNALADAIRELEVLVATTSPPQERTKGRNKKSQDDPNYPIIHPVSAKGKAIMLRALEELAKLDYYRQEPETANHYTSTGVFLWPVEEIHPDFAFGSSHALLDQLRTTYHCFISFDSRRSLFRVFGENDNKGLENVRDVVKSLNVAFCECAAMKSLPLEVYLVRPPHSLEAKTTVRMVNACVVLGKQSKNTVLSTGNTLGATKSAQLSGASIDKSRLAIWDQEMAKVEAKNKAILEKAITSSLSRLLYRRGRIQMRTQVGLFGFSRYFAQKGAPETPIETFMRNISSSSTKGNLQLIDLGSAAVEKLFKGIWSADDILEPLSPNANTLKDVNPMYSGFLQFPQGRADTIKLRIEADYVFSGIDGTYNILRREWSKQSPTNKPPLQIYEVPLMNHLTWRMSINTDEVLYRARIATKITQFGEEVRLRAQTSGPDSLGKPRLMFEIPPFHDLQVNFHQTATWRYRLKVDRSYTFEVIRVDMYRVGNTSRSASSNQAHISSQWGFKLWSTSWDEVFSENLTLQLGNKASWSPTLSTLFRTNHSKTRPGPVSGFDDYLKILEDVLAVLGAVLNDYPSKADD